MNCNDVEKLLIEGEALSQEAREHLASCKSCRSLSRLMDGVMQVKPSAALDKAVLTQVKAEMRMRGRRRPAWIHIAYAAAASVLLLLSIWIGHRQFWNDTPAAGGDVVAAVDEQETGLDPLVGIWMAADQDIEDVEFVMDYSDIVAAADTGDAADDMQDDNDFSSKEFSDLADGMFSLELIMYQPVLN